MSLGLVMQITSFVVLKYDTEKSNQKVKQGILWTY